MMLSDVRDVLCDVTKPPEPQSESGCRIVARGAYLRNRVVDFVHFLQVNGYGVVGFTLKKLAPSDQYLRHDRIFSFPWQPIGIFKFRFREVFFVPLLDLRAKFGARRSINRGGVSTQTNIQTFLKGSYWIG